MIVNTSRHSVIYQPVISDLHSAINKAIAMSVIAELPVLLLFNDIELEVKDTSRPVDIARHYFKRIEERASRTTDPRYYDQNYYPGHA